MPPWFDVGTSRGAGRCFSSARRRDRPARINWHGYTHGCGASKARCLLIPFLSFRPHSPFLSSLLARFANSSPFPFPTSPILRVFFPSFPFHRHPRTMEARRVAGVPPHHLDARPAPTPRPSSILTKRAYLGVQVRGPRCVRMPRSRLWRAYRRRRDEGGWGEGMRGMRGSRATMRGEVRAACWDADTGGGSPKRAVML